MAMKRKDKPLRPDPSRIGADVRGSLSTKKTIMVRPKGRLSKSVVRNPSAPTAAGPRGGGVRVLTKSESALKKDKARVARTGQLPITRTVTDSMKTSGKKSYKPSTGDQKLIDATQYIRSKGYTSLTAAEKKAANEKMKSKGVTPKKKAEAPKKTTPKRKLYIGRGGGMRGGYSGLMGGGGLPDYNK